MLDSTVHHGYVFGMSYAIDLATVAALLGDPARANILAVLQDGRAQTATELAYAAGVSPQTTSGHLAKLTDARLLSLQKQGRHRYYRLASPLVGRMLEAVMAVAAVGPPPRAARRVHETLWQATEAGIAAAVPGNTAADVFHAQAAVLEAAGIPLGNVGRFGHGLGKVMTEFPSNKPIDKTPLRPGMVLTIEPSAAYGAGKILVHEENLVITDGTPDLLTRRAPRGMVVADLS